MSGSCVHSPRGRWLAITVSATLIATLTVGVAPLLPIPPAAALTIGAPTNATAQVGNEDEAAIAVNPNNTQQVAVFTNGVGGDAGLPLAISQDGGQTWTRSTFATGTGAGGDGRPAACCDPTLSWDNHGNLFIGYLWRSPPAPPGAPRSIELYVTSDLGANFTNLGPVDTDTGSAIDQPTVVAAANSVWVTWRDENGIAARGRSVTGALTFGAWGAEQDVAPNGNFGDIAIGPAGAVMVTYQTPAGDEGPSTIFVHTDADGLGPVGFGAAVTATTTNVGGFDFLPAQPGRSVDAEAGLAWDRSGGANNNRVYLVYTDETPAESNDFDIFVRWSNDDGATWPGGPVQVNDDAGTNSQMLPRIALDQTNGDIGVTFYDARGDTGGGSNATDLDGTANNDVTLFASWSTNGGANWAANVAVADAPTDGYNMNGNQELGDYTGAAFHGGVLYPAWADSSNSTGDNPAGTRVSLDVYTAAVRPNNDAPVVSVDPASGVEGAVINIAGSATDADLDPLTYSWTVMPLTTDAFASCTITNGTTVAPSVQCSDDGTYTATLTATGDPSGPVSASNVITVTNANPTLSSPSNTPSTINEGQSTTFVANFADAGWNDTYSGSINWGFGAPEAVAPIITTAGSAGVADSGTIGGAHTYVDDGSFNVTATVTDDDLGAGSASAAVTVANVNPTATIDETGTILINGVPAIITNAGSPVNFSGRSTDPGSDDLTVTWDWDDGPPVPDVSTTYLHDSLLNPDPDPSPDGLARDITDSKAHTFGQACFYDVGFASADDDSGTGSDTVAVVIVGNFAETRSHGYFKAELRRPRDHTGAGLQCLLDITGFMSRVFHEVVNASNSTLATAVFNKAGSSLATDIFDLQLLAAWMNFADGRVALTDMVDSDGDLVPDITFGALINQAETVRLDPLATRAQLLAQKNRLERVNLANI